ncbi:MAG TPA: hypothetical protein VGK44_15885 [Casimicrobiaceae bacterium]|jgi:hypothetical protein
MPARIDDVDHATAVDIDLVFDHSVEPVAAGIVFVVGNGAVDALVIVELDSVGNPKRHVIILFRNALARCGFVVDLEQRPKEGRDQEITCRNSLSRAPDRSGGARR